MESDLFLVTGKDDFVAGDEGSIVLCRSCFEDQQRGVGEHKVADTFVFKAKAFLSADTLGCEGHLCCKAHHGQVCVDAKNMGNDCRREYQFDERRAKTRERLRDAVLNRRIAQLESVAAVSINLLGWLTIWIIWKTIKSDMEALGPVVSTGFWILAAVVVTFLGRDLLHGSMRKLIRLPK